MFGHRKKAANNTVEISALSVQLGKVSFFEGFSAEELARVASLAEEVVAEKGAVLIDQGRVGLECYVILEGQAGVYVSGDHVATNGPGSMIGEMALVEHRPRNATVVAETDMVLIAFDTKAFKTLLEEMPLAHDRVMVLLASRLKENQGVAADTPSGAPAEGDAPGGPSLH
jgi:CRP/FNR family transcriptional regulator, cyclic AMP receptor protein